jgi:uncharacterized protein YuzE
MINSAKEKPKFQYDYDKENGSFIMHEENAKTDFCISFSDVIIDIGKDGKIVGFEILNADKLSLWLEEIYENEKGEMIIKQFNTKTGEKKILGDKK